MPHVIVKLYAGRSDEQKSKLAEAICEAVTRSLQCDEKSVSVGIEDIAPADWTEKVYKPDISARTAQIYKQPG